jgi:hypothetical protein
MLSSPVSITTKKSVVLALGLPSPRPHVEFQETPPRVAGNH